MASAWFICESGAVGAGTGLGRGLDIVGGGVAGFAGVGCDMVFWKKLLKAVCVLVSGFSFLVVILILLLDVLNFNVCKAGLRSL